ncbi:DUF4838 domain-containing protein [Paenibacillus eucommiae]|uniref:SLH domain-containing protein n=1 Tax=Paenibacillus eucommiae TaxID=1355755 RepID=A0ABS4INR9_9BACL|nr:DUF4838 domain-containing protein [Paenibacillus eucommiae]MBP1988681.1 hypothetical protein [Paenibacillus eucommiae]
MITKRKSGRIFILFLTISLIYSTFGSAIATVSSAETNSAGKSSLSYSQFPDIDGHWAEQAIQEWTASGRIQGYPDGTFQPDRTIGRSEAIVLINRSLGFNDPAPIDFSDLSVANWEYDDVAKAVKAKYVVGYADGTIRANLQISRQEAAIIINRLLGWDEPKETSAANGFTDANMIPQWSKGAVAAVAAANIMSGYQDGSFRPESFITRAELVVTLDRVLKSKASFDFKETGTYGPAQGMRTINGNVVVDSPGVTLQNMKISGNLLLAEGIAEGDVYLDHVTVLGTTTVQGGGINSIHLKDCAVSEVIVDKKHGTVRIIAEGMTEITTVTVKSAALLEEARLSGPGFVNVLLDAALQAGAEVTLNGSFDNVDVSAAKIVVKFTAGTIKNIHVLKGADGSTLKIDEKAAVTRLVLDAILKAIGSGTIESVKINENGKGSTFEKQPGKVEGVGPASTATQSGDGNTGGNPGGNPGGTPGPTETPPPVNGKTIVKDGLGKAKIVLLPFDGDADTKRSIAWNYLTPAEIATVLVEYVQKATGAVLPVVTEEPAGYDGVKIYIGGSSTEDAHQHQAWLSELNEQGFIIDSQKDGRISIIGNNLGGLEFGVYEFLERYVGISWLMPGPDGEDVPQNSTLVIPQALVTDQPKTLSRYMYSGNKEAVKKWQRFLRTDYNFMTHHNLYELFDPKVFKDHPEYYVGGVVPTSLESWQPCFNDDTAAAAIARIKEHFQANPSYTSYSLAINDLGYEYCEATTKINSVGIPNMSDIYYPWVNKIAEGVLEEYPGKYFGVLAYREMYDPPVNEDGTSFKLNPQVVPFITDDRLTWSDPELGNAGKDLTERWLQSATNLGYYEYLYGTPYNIPRTYVHRMADNYKYEQENGAIAHVAELITNFGEGPKPWVAAKLEWNADQDVDALLQQWYKRAVGEAAAPYLKQYFDHWEEFWTSRVFQSEWYLEWKNRDKRSNYLDFSKHGYLKEITKEELADSRKLLEKVAALAVTDPQKKRVQLLLRAFEFYEASALSYPKDKPAIPTSEEAAMKMLDEVKVSYQMGQERNQLINEFVELFDSADSSIGIWDGIQRQMISVLQSYVTNEPEDGPVRRALRAFLKQIPGFQGIAEQLSAYAVKTNAGKETILNALDFHAGPWTAAEPFSDFLIMDTKASPPVKTKVYLLWDDENLYVGYENFINEGDKLVISDNADDGWWSSGYDDSNETYITPDPDAGMKGFFTNPKAVKFVIEKTNTGLKLVTDGNWEANAVVNEDRWNLVQVIPFASIGVDNPNDNRTLQGFFFRNYIGGTNWISWGGGATWKTKYFNPVHLVESKNLIGNPSFEDGNGDVPVLWSSYVVSPSYVKRSTVPVVTGEYSMMADGLWGGMSLYQVLPAAPGKYRASFYYFVPGNTETEGEIFWIAGVRNNTGDYLPYNRSEQIPLKQNKGNWNYYDFEYEIKADYEGEQPADQVVNLCISNMKPGEKVFFDDVAVYKIE